MKRFLIGIVAFGIVFGSGVSFAQDQELPPIPGKVQRMLAKNIGHWTVSAKGTILGETVFKWGPQQRYVTMEGEFQDGAISGVLCWDGLSENGFIMQGVAPTGYFTDRMKVVSESVAEGMRTGVMGGKHTSSAFRIEIQGPDQLLTSWTESTTEGVKQPDIVEICTRIKPTTLADFEQFCRLNEGRWAGKITWAADWPGLGKKGDTVTVYRQNRISQDGNAFISDGFAGKGSSTVLLSHDPGAQLIRGMEVSSGGSLSQITVRKAGEEWLWAVRQVEADGTEVEILCTATLSDEGKTWTEKGHGTRGEEKVEFVDVFHRVSK